MPYVESMTTGRIIPSETKQSTCRGIDPVKVQCNKNVDIEFSAKYTSLE